MHRGLILAGMLLALFAGGSIAPVHAESGSDYARAVVPDVAVATAFLRDDMGCDVLDAGSERALLECGQGSVVEVVRGQPRTASQTVLRLHTDNADATLGWLRRQHVPLAAGQGSGTVGPDGLLRVELGTPWGQTLELIGHASTSLPTGNPLAAD